MPIFSGLWGHFSGRGSYDPKRLVSGSLGAQFGRGDQTIGRRTFTSMVAIGDSYTDGAVYAEASDFAHSWLGLFSAHFGVTALNNAVSGTVLQNSNYTGGVPHSNNARDNYVADMLGSSTRQLAVIAHGFNCARGPDFPATFNAVNFKNDLTEIVNGLIAGGYTRDYILIVSPWWLSDAGLNTGSAGFSGQTRVGFEAYVTASREVAQAYGLYFADAYTAGNGITLVDDIHPGDAGHAVYAVAALAATQYPAPVLADQFLLDNFTDTDATALTAHMADTGLRWGLPAGSGAVVAGNRARSAGITAIQPNFIAPTKGANYYVEAVIQWFSTIANDNIGICGRYDQAADAFYTVRYTRATNTWGLFRVVGGVSTQIGGNIADSFTSGTKTLRLTMIGTTISAQVGGSTIVSGTDSAISLPGLVGLRMGGSVTASTGMHFESIRASH